MGQIARMICFLTLSVSSLIALHGTSAADVSPEIAAGGYHTVALKADGTVWAWGTNGFGELGDGTFEDRSMPVQVIGLSGVTAVAANISYTVALKVDGTVWTWGTWGTGTIDEQSNVPVQVSGLTAVTAIAAGWDHTVALTSDGTVWAWGRNVSGQLGDGTTNSTSIPVQVTGLTSVKAIAAGNGHTLAVETDGTVWAWGSNSFGKLGNGSVTPYSMVPAQVGLYDVVAVTAGGNHSVALKLDGTVWAWGLNGVGQLGDGTLSDSSVPVQVAGLSGVVAIDAQADHTVVLKNNGMVWAWGMNGYGQLGDGTTTHRNTPVRVAGLSGVVAVAAGAPYSIALKADGTVWAWGWNEYGEFGNGRTTLSSSQPIQVRGLADVTGLPVGGWRHATVIKNDGSAWAWGMNDFGQIGDGGTSSPGTPVLVVGPSDVTAIADGDLHTIGLRSDGSVWTWGHNGYGQLGDGTLTDRSTPVQVPDFLDATAAAGGSTHTVAVKTDGTVWAWGEHLYGAVSNSDVPVQITELSGVVAVAAGRYHTAVLKDDGTVWTWGENNFFQLGDGTANSSSIPVEVTGLTGVTAIASGWHHTVALRSDGTLYAWGFNPYGQLGDGTTTHRNTPVPVASLSGVTAIAAGALHTVALKSDGTIWAWGYNEYGQLGDGTRTSSLTPVQVTGLSAVASISAGGYHSIALKPDGTIWTWGELLGLIDLPTPAAINLGTTWSVLYVAPVVAVTMGPDAANASRVQILDGDFVPVSSFYAFDADTVRYGGRVALGDVDGDGVDEVIVAKGEHVSNNSEVKIFELDGTPLSGANLIPFSSAFTKGVRVATADFDDDGREEVIVGTSEGQGLVRIFSYDVSAQTLEDTWLLLNAYGAGANGVNVAASDVDGDGLPELMTAPASKTELPSIKVWDVDTSGGMGNWTATAHSSFLPSNVLQSASGGGAVLSGSATSFAVGSGVMGGKVEVYSGSDVYDCSFTVSDPGTRQRYGVELAIGDMNADGVEEVVMGLGHNADSDSGFYIYEHQPGICNPTSYVTSVFAGSTHGGRIAIGKTPVGRSQTAIPGTGQSSCDNGYGDVIPCPPPGDPMAQDGSYFGRGPLYMDNLDGTVTDTVTGLMWQQADDGFLYNWYEATGTADIGNNPGGAIDVCGNLALGGYSDWRAPSVSELVGIVHYGRSAPAIDPVFRTVVTGPLYNPADSYWGADNLVPGNVQWAVNFMFGRVDIDYFPEDRRVRCVRGGRVARSFIDNGNGTATDGASGLVWQIQDDGVVRTWTEALGYCENLSLLGATDWRLPNVKELESTVDYTQTPLIAPVFFNGYPAGYYYYWSATYGGDNGYDPYNAWTADYGYGQISPVATSETHYVRCVHGGL